MAGTLAHSPADVIRWALVQLGIGSDPTLTTLLTWPVYESTEPTSPDDCLTVYDTTPSDADGYTMPDGRLQSRYGFQVRVRAARKPAGFVKANAIQVALNESIRNTQVDIDDSTYIVAAVRCSDPLWIGYDSGKSKRVLFTLNGTVTLEQHS